jgi:hypothetical protein
LVGKGPEISAQLPPKMKFAANTLFLAATIPVDAFQPHILGRRIPLISSRRPTLIYVGSLDDAKGDIVVLEDVDGLGAVAAKSDLMASSVTLNVTDPLNEDMMQLLVDVEEEANKAAEELMDEECEFDAETGGPKDELCVEGVVREGFRARLKRTIGETLKMVRGMPGSDDSESVENEMTLAEGDILEQGWSDRGATSALRRNAEVWKFALKSVFRVLKPRSMKKKGASDAEISKAQTEAAEFIRDGLLTLGPTFVKLGQVRLCKGHCSLTLPVPLRCPLTIFLSPGHLYQN